MDELMQIREKGVKGFFRKITDARIETGAVADYKQEIVQCTRVFEVRTPCDTISILRRASQDTTKLCQIQLEAEGRLSLTPYSARS